MDKSIIEQIEKEAYKFGRNPSYNLNIYSTLFYQYGAHFGYHLRDKEVEELKEKLDQSYNEYDCAFNQSNENAEEIDKLDLELEKNLHP